MGSCALPQLYDQSYHIADHLPPKIVRLPCQCCVVLVCGRPVLGAPSMRAQVQNVCDYVHPSLHRTPPPQQLRVIELATFTKSQAGSGSCVLYPLPAIMQAVVGEYKTSTLPGLTTRKIVISWRHPHRLARTCGISSTMRTARSCPTVAFACATFSPEVLQTIRPVLSRAARPCTLPSRACVTAAATCPARWSAWALLPVCSYL